MVKYFNVPDHETIPSVVCIHILNKELTTVISETRNFSDNSFRIMLLCNYAKLSNLSLDLTTNKDE